MLRSNTHVAMLTLAMLAGSGPAPAAEPSPEERRLIADFDAFAEKEWPTIVSEIGTGLEHAIELDVATKLPMTKKNLYLVFWIDEQPDDYFAEVIRSNSLEFPYKGVIKFSVKVRKGSVLVKGPKKHCREKPLRECLEHGGELATGMFSGGGDFTVAQLHEVVLSYVPKQDSWERERDEPVLEIIATEPSISSLDR
jgi:hypothetical protein